MDLRGLIKKQTGVDMKLAKDLIFNGPKDSNFVFSPLSLHLLISTIAAGAKGSTLDQLLWFLKSESIQEVNTFSKEVIGWLLKDGSARGGPPLLSVANGVWSDKSSPLKHSFKQTLERHYKAAVKQVDFQNQAGEVIKEVNAWAESETRGLIKEILSPGSVDSTTRLILANAIYFKGTWRKKFNESFTRNYDFYLLNGGSVNVPFMTSYDRQFVSAFDGFKVLSLPYRRGQDDRQFSMCVFLPNEKEGLPALLEKVGSESGFLDQHMPRREVKVGDFRLPRFKISFGFEASNALKRLGLTLPFCMSADLTEMVDEQLYVSKMYHKSFIEVNEVGTEAAAVSVAVMEYGCGMPMHREDPIDFVADHPFLFLIREDRTGSVMFFGQVINPE